MAKEIKYGIEARKALEEGVNKLANTVRAVSYTHLVKAFGGQGVLGYFNKMSELLADVSLYTIDYNSDDSLIAVSYTHLF